MSLRLRFAFALCLVSSLLLHPSYFSLSAATPEDFRLRSDNHRPINPALDLSTTTVTFATDQIPQAKVTGLPAAIAGKVNNTGNETIAGIKTFSSAPVVPAAAFPESATLNLTSDLAGKVNDTGDETIAGVKTFSSAPVVPAAAFPESATLNLTSDLAGKVNDTGDETIAGIKTFSSKPVVPSAAFPESATLNLTSDLAGKVNDTGNETIAGIKTFSSNPVVPAAAFPESATFNLTSDLAAKALDSAVVHNSGTEIVAGVKAFSSAPTVPSSAFPESAIANLTSDLAAKAPDSAVVHNTGAESIAGSKTFSSALAVLGATSASSTSTGSIGISSLASPGAPAVTHTGVPGATTWSYRIVAKLADGTGTAGGATGSTTTGNATLDTSNYNNLSWSAVTGAVTYDVYRTVAGLVPSTTGKLTNTAAVSYNDQGAAADGSTVPSSNSTGNIQWLADNISDIGGAFSARPRDINVARNANIGGNGTVGGTFAVTNTLSSAAQISNLNFIDVSRAPYSADMTGTVDGTAAFNAAISAAATGNKTVFIPGILKITSTIAITSEVVLLGVPYKSKILWAGGSGGTMMRITGAQRGGIRNLELACNNLAATGLIIDGSSFGDYTDLSITNFTTGTGLQLTGVAATCSWNTFARLILISATNGNSCLWLGDSGSPGSNACHNVFINLYLEHNGTRPGIRLGDCDNNAFYHTFIFRSSGTNAGVLVDPTEAAGLPAENIFSLLEAGSGGWVQPGTTTACPATIYSYATGNGQPAPVTNGTPLIVYFSDGRGSTWLAPTLVNGWVNFGAPQQVAGYTQDVNNRIWLRGLIKSGTFSDNTTLLTLPAGYRPSGNESFAVNSSGAFAVIIILTTGEVKISGATANSALSLAGISFSEN
jgi:hypothetical protein